MRQEQGKVKLRGKIAAEQVRRFSIYVRYIMTPRLLIFVSFSGAGSLMGPVDYVFHIFSFFYLYSLPAFCFLFIDIIILDHPDSGDQI